MSQSKEHKSTLVILNKVEFTKKDGTKDYGWRGRFKNSATGEIVNVYTSGKKSPSKDGKGEVLFLNLSVGRKGGAEI